MMVSVCLEQAWLILPVSFLHSFRFLSFLPFSFLSLFLPFSLSSFFPFLLSLLSFLLSPSILPQLLSFLPSFPSISPPFLPSSFFFPSLSLSTVADHVHSVSTHKSVSHSSICTYLVEYSLCLLHAHAD